MRGCEGRLRSRLSAKLRCTCRRRRRRPSSSADGSPERRRASQRRSQRRRVLVYEPAISAVTKTATDKSPDLLHLPIASRSHRRLFQRGHDVVHLSVTVDLQALHRIRSVIGCEMVPVLIVEKLEIQPLA